MDIIAMGGLVERDHFSVLSMGTHLAEMDPNSGLKFFPQLQAAV